MSVARISGPQLLDTALWTASGEEKAELHAWEKENLDRSDHPDVGTANWPGWRKYTGSPPRRTLMTRVVFGCTTAEVERKLGGEPRERLHTCGVIVGAPNEIVAQLGALAEAGVQQVMLQWLEVDDVDGLEAFARSVLPQL